jgi:hypothetical protein
MLQFACKKALAFTVFSVLVPCSAWALTGESFQAYEDLKAKAELKTRGEAAQRDAEAEVKRNKTTEENVSRLLRSAFDKQPESVGEVHSLEVHLLGLTGRCVAPKRARECAEEVAAAFAYQNSKEACQGEQIERFLFYTTSESETPAQTSYLRVSCVNRISLDERKVWIVLDRTENSSVKEILLKQDKRKL